MAALLQPPPHLLSVAEYAELGEAEAGYSELVEGRLVMAPGPIPDHNVASGELFLQLRGQVPEDLEVIQDIDVDLELAAAGAPGFARRPDLVILNRAARPRVREHGGLVRAAEVAVVIEIVSEGSRRTGRVAKRSEYAEAGIGHYWIIDLAPRVSLLACHQQSGVGYADGGEVTGAFEAAEPFAVRLDLGRLL